MFDYNYYQKQLLKDDELNEKYDALESNFEENIISFGKTRILPNDKDFFASEPDFRCFIEKTMLNRDGKYFFRSQMMSCPYNTLVLFQYDGMIRAIGILTDSVKETLFDEFGVKFAGYYKFDVNSLQYLETPITKDMLKIVYPDFKGFNQSKQAIPSTYTDAVLSLIQTIDSFVVNDAELISEIEQNSIEGAEKIALLKVRVNQTIFRRNLLQKYSICCLCGVSNESLLVASHIKPWADSNSKEKVDVENGLLLCPNHDKLFDGGWISFDDNGSILISDKITLNDRILMNIRKDMKISLTRKKKQYLQYHREKVFKN